MDSDRFLRIRARIDGLAREGLDWVSFASEVTDTISRSIRFDRCCWHTVDPGTMLFTGSVHRNITCSGLWLAKYEYVVEDVNKWWFLARSGQHAGATSIATRGELTRSARHCSQEAFGLGDELRGSFVAAGNYWGAASFLRDQDTPWFTPDDVRLLASLSESIAAGLRAALVNVTAVHDAVVATDGPGLVVYDAAGRPELISPAAERWIAQLIEDPPPDPPSGSGIVQSVAARTRSLGRGNDPLQQSARSRVRTRSGTWLTLYGTALAGEPTDRVAVIIQPAAFSEVAPLVALAHGLTDREGEIVRLCMQGHSTKQMATDLAISAYTVQDHLKSIFDKTGVRSRNELVGQVFLQHYCPRWEDVDGAPSGWGAQAMPRA